MNKEFTPYEEALAMKELGFDEPCFGYCYTQDSNAFHKEKEFVQTLLINGYQGYGNKSALSGSQSNERVNIPLYQQAFRWFRGKYNFYSNILGESLNGELNGYYYSITEEGWINYYESIDNNRLYKTYEEAELACLQTLIKIVQDENN